MKYILNEEESKEYDRMKQDYQKLLEVNSKFEEVKKILPQNIPIQLLVQLIQKEKSLLVLTKDKKLIRVFHDGIIDFSGKGFWLEECKDLDTYLYFKDYGLTWAVEEDSFQFENRYLTVEYNILDKD